MKIAWPVKLLLSALSVKKTVGTHVSVYDAQYFCCVKCFLFLLFLVPLV